MSTKYIASNWRLPNEENSNKSDNYGLSFDGSEFINCGSSSALLTTGAFSVSFWMKTTVTANDALVLMDDWSAGNRNWQIVHLSSGNVIRFFVFGSPNASVLANTSINDGNWHHVVCTYEPSTALRIYIDGSLDNSNTTSIPATRNNSAANLRIGKDDFNAYYTGDISEVAVFDYALSESQISTLYGSSSLGAGNPMALKPQPVAFYNLADNSSGNPLTQPNEAVEDASAFEFSTQDYIEYPYVNIDSAFTVSTWVKTTDTSTYGNLFSSSNQFGGGPNIFNNWKLIRWNRSARFNASNSSNSVIFDVNTGTASTRPNLYDGEWHHVVGIWDGTTNANGVKIFFDGVLRGLGTATSTAINTDSSIPIRAGSSLSNFDFIGEQANQQIWNTALTYGSAAADGDTAGGEVAELYNNGQPLMTGTQPQASNLKAWYKLDQSANWDVSGSGNWTIPDASGNGNDGTSSGMTSANLVLSDLTRAVPYDSYSFNFDSASSDYIQTTSNSLFNGLTAFSISCWIKRNGTQQFYAAVLSYQTSTSQYLKLNFDTYTDKIEMSIRPGSTSPVKVISSAGSIPDGEWVHIAVVGDADNLSNLNMYINGVLDNDVTSGNITTLAQSSDIYIGTDAGAATTREFNGKISNISVFDEALTSTEVLKLYANGVPQDLTNFTPQPQAWWPLGSNSFWNGSQWTVRDMSTGGSNDGTGQNIGVDGLVGDAPRSEANGTGTNMDVPTNLEGSTKWSENNSWSINMSSTARVEDTP